LHNDHLVLTPHTGWCGEFYDKGTRNPSVALLKRLAEAMDSALRIEFVPKKI